MAGPCLQVLTHVSTDVLTAHTKHLLSAIADQVNEDTFSVAGQPFCYYIKDSDEEERAVGLDGWYPTSILGYCAMTRRQSAHVLLATLAIRSAEALKGWIQLDGTLAQATSAVTILTMNGGNDAVTTEFGWDVIRPSLMKYWLGEEHFRLPG